MKSISSFFFLIEIIEIPSLHTPQAIDFLKRNLNSQETLHALITPFRVIS